ncbi:hypothetical protein AVEN_208687-1 [Araneus ventricosus]|uniref:Uncharacterized protein n=1 Tax=Araneus ventricosus TaxID=182803 RepID=A0A4Y2MXT4_ARAVE|nr:hypothetical protein AVEN_208687-1 [Araneus ventricosus]
MPAVIVVFEGESEFPLSLLEELGRSRILGSLYFNGLRNQRVKQIQLRRPIYTVYLSVDPCLKLMTLRSRSPATTMRPEIQKDDLSKIIGIVCIMPHSSGIV